MFKKIDKVLSNIICKLIGHDWIKIDYRGIYMCKMCYKCKKDLK